MSETTSAKEMEDRERFRPSHSEIEAMREALNRRWFPKTELKEVLDEWIEAETERRMTEACYDNGFPIPRRLKCTQQH